MTKELSDDTLYAKEQDLQIAKNFGLSSGTSGWGYYLSGKISQSESLENPCEGIALVPAHSNFTKGIYTSTF